MWWPALWIVNCMVGMAAIWSPPRQPVDPSKNVTRISLKWLYQLMDRQQLNSTLASFPLANCTKSNIRSFAEHWLVKKFRSLKQEQSDADGSSYRFGMSSGDFQWSLTQWTLFGNCANIPFAIQHWLWRRTFKLCEYQSTWLWFRIWLAQLNGSPNLSPPPVS